MERLLVFQHVPHETAGTYLEVAEAEGVQVEVMQMWNGVPSGLDFGKYSGLLVMGGPQGAYDSSEQYPTKEFELAAIRKFGADGKPVLGTCLGSQLIATAYGARVYPNIISGSRYKEIGMYPATLTEDGARDKLFKGFPKEFKVLQWHGDVFDLPREARLLVRGDEKVPNQAFSIGEKTYALLFHFEIDPALAEKIAKIDSKWIHDGTNLDDKRFFEEIKVAGAETKRLAELLFRNWLALR